MRSPDFSFSITSSKKCIYDEAEVQTKNKPALKQCKGLWMKYYPGEPSKCYFESLSDAKTLQVYKTHRRGFIKFLCGANLHHNDRELNSRNPVFMLQSNLPGKCTCTGLIGHCNALSDDVALQSSINAKFNFFARRPCVLFAALAPPLCRWTPFEWMRGPNFFIRARVCLNTATCITVPSASAVQYV